MKTTMLVGTLWLGVACSSEGTSPPPSGRPAADRYGVRVAGGEASDFGNGDEPCGPSSVDTVLTEQQAEAAGFNVDADRAALAMSHVAALRWNPVECAVEPELCEPTQMELRAQAVEPILVKVENSRTDDFCPAEGQYFAYRVAVSLESEDGNLAGTFYDTVLRSESEDGVVTFRGGASPHLWNFEGALPIELDLARSHYAYLSISFSLANDGSATGKLEPMVSYYGPSSTDGGGAAGATGDDATSGYASPRIGPDAFFATDPSDFAQESVFDGISVLALDGERSTLASYPGALVEPLVDLSVRADAVEPARDVDLSIWVDGDQIHDRSVAAGTLVELGRHPFGTSVVVDVHNNNGADAARANILQDNCFQASVTCRGQDCTAHAEYTAAHAL